MCGITLSGEPAGERADPSGVDVLPGEEETDGPGVETAAAVAAGAAAGVDCAGVAVADGDASDASLR